MPSRHIVVDTMGLLLLVVITSAGVQERDGARRLLEKVKMAMPSLALLWADGDVKYDMTLRNRLLR